MRSKRELPFDPDPGYRLPKALEDQLAFWVDKEAARHLLSGLTPEERDLWVSEILSRPRPPEDSTNPVGRESIPEVQPFGDSELDFAVWNLYSRVRDWHGLGDSYPFPQPDARGKPG
jgi:hypothetical protein